MLLVLYPVMVDTVTVAVLSFGLALTTLTPPVCLAWVLPLILALSLVVALTLLLGLTLSQSLAVAVSLCLPVPSLTVGLDLLLCPCLWVSVGQTCAAPTN